MKKNVPVSTIMTKNVIKLNLKDELTKAEALFKKHNIRHIPVVSGSKIIGILSYSDLLRISFADAVYEDEEIDSVVYDMFDIGQVMTKNIVSITENTSIKETAEILASKEFHALPVLEDGHLVGIVTTTDLIKYLLNQYI
ncbi:CBS domain-containing protein [uncultured Planktosalinus sp.]|mgnify:CR=1 FL=1|uniref:CBS domain-containing protein n=1 Tax=uncultured Planktosalinus sp. TaxID=1810935 RepID=UPI0030D9A57D